MTKQTRTPRKRDRPSQVINFRVPEREVLENLLKKNHRNSARVRQRWLTKPRLYTEPFELAVELAELSAGQSSDGPIVSRAIERSRQHYVQLDSIKTTLRWNFDQLVDFTDKATEFARCPSMKTYLAIRTDFPELDIHVGASGGLRAFLGLMSKFEDFDLDLSLITGAMAGFEPDVDRLCLDLMRKIVEAEKAEPLDRYQVAESRPRKVPKTVVNFLISQMLEAFDYDKEVRVPASLVLLILHQLGPLRGDIYAEYSANRARKRAASLVAHKLKAGESLSVNRLSKLANIPRSTAGRWLREGFRQEVESAQKILSIIRRPVTRSSRIRSARAPTTREDR